MIFDTHTHLNVEEFAGREAEEIALAAEMGVTQMNIVGFDKPTIEHALELVDEYEQLYATIGWHLQKLVLIQRKLRLTCWIS